MELNYLVIAVSSVSILKSSISCVFFLPKTLELYGKVQIKESRSETQEHATPWQVKLS